jgi:hypothetical protein
MSTQLIVYPQNYDGTYNSLLIMAGEFVVDGFWFAQINSSDSYDSPVATNQLYDVLQNQPPTTVNTWYRFRSTVSGTPTLPTMTGSFLTATLNLYSAVSGSVSGVYQLISNLTPQVYYDLIVDISSPTVDGVLMLAVYNGTNYVTDQLHLVTASTTQVTLAFPAVSTNLTIFVNYINSTNDFIGISKISVQEQGVAPTPAYTELADGQVICDLYEDEDIPLTLSIDEFKNVAEKVQSYSKSFNLPATKRNNLIFDNVFEITRTTSGVNFNPYIKTKCVLKQDGYILFDGYLRLIDIQDKKGEISYNVNLYSEVVALADTLKDKIFRDLNFDELQHPYNLDEIKDTWTLSGTPTYSNPNTSGFRDAATLKYPFVDWNHQFTVSGGMPVLPNLESVFRPFIQIKYLIERIFADSPFTFTSDFFDTNEFKNLYMDFNWGTDVNPNSVETLGRAFFDTDEPDVYATTSWTNFEFVDFDMPTAAGWDDGLNRFVCPQDNTTYSGTYRASVFAKRDADIEFQWLKNGTTVIDPSGPQSLQGSAVATFVTATQGGNSGTIFSITIVDGGYYTSPPTITIDSTFGSGATFTTTIDVSGAVDSITIVTEGSGYSFWDLAVFNNVNPVYDYAGLLNETLDFNDTLELQWKATTSNYIRQNNSPHNNGLGYPWNWSSLFTTVSFVGVTGDILLQTLRGDIEQWGFLKGIMTMFNLISMPDPNNPTNILIEPYADVFITHTSGMNLGTRSIQHDWTDKVDVSEMKLTPLTDLNKTTIFKFVEDDDDYAFMNYKNSVGGHLYGSKEVDASTMYGGLQSVLEGEEEIVAEPFAATVVKPLMDIYTDFIVPVVYSYNLDDGTSEGFDNSPRIMYNNGLNYTTTGAYDIPAQNGVGAETAYPWFLQFSHLSNIPVSSIDNDFHFGECQLLIGGGTLNNLYNTYWAPYFDELYNSDTRMMTLKVNLTPADINMFEFTDKVFIKNRVFRVNKINYKPNDLATVEFILIP